MIPSYYRKIEIKYSKFGIEDFNFSVYNKTKYGGLENHIRNEYLNSLLQTYFFLSEFRQVCKSHLKEDCPSNLCLMCEIGFLFRMLEDAKGINCQAANFYKAFSSIPQGKYNF